MLDSAGGRASAGQSSAPCAAADELVACQKAVRKVHVDEKIRRYLMEIIHSTRDHEDVALGASPRASLALFRAVAGDGGHLGSRLCPARRCQTRGRARAHPSLDHSAREPAAQGDERIDRRRLRGGGAGRRSPKISRRGPKESVRKLPLPLGEGRGEGFVRSATSFRIGANKITAK